MDDCERLIEELCTDEEWHMRELSVYKSIPHRYGTASFETIKKTYWKMCVPMVYAHWEGFCVGSLKKVCEYINKRNINYNTAIDEIAVLAMNQHLQSLSGQNIGKEKAVLFYRTFLEKYKGTIEIDTTIAVSAHSNLNYKRLVYMMGQVGIDVESVSEISSRRNIIEKLVTFRNKIAHGENSLIVEEKDVVTFIHEINVLFDALIIVFDSFLKEEQFMIQT